MIQRLVKHQLLVKFCNIHSWVKSISTLRYFPIYFILNHLFSTHSPEVIPCLIFMKFSALSPKINIISSSYIFHKIVFILFLMTWFKHKVRFLFIKSCYMIVENCDVANLCLCLNQKCLLKKITSKCVNKLQSILL